jgi:hypothetical protein
VELPADRQKSKGARAARVQSNRVKPGKNRMIGANIKQLKLGCVGPPHETLRRTGHLGLHPVRLLSQCRYNGINK